MWTAKQQQLLGGRVLRFVLERDGRPAGAGDVLAAWQGEAAFRLWFGGLIAGAPFAALRWETPPLTATTLSRPFEFVLLDSPGLAAHPDATDFAEHFRRADGDVVEFTNLGGDARLIAPCPLGPHSHYGHLVAFLRGAPEHQQHALWQLVGESLQCRLSTRPVWLSTAGAGVSWLHVRLDDRPKYYGYAPYRTAP